MKMKLLASLILMAPLIAHADDTPIPSNIKGIVIVPMAKQGLPASMKKEVMASQKEQKEKGFITTSDNRASYLLNIQRNKDMQFKLAKANNYGDQDTTLKNSSSQIKLAFPFTSIKGVDSKNIIGFAAIGSYDKEKGWNGIKEIFSNPKLGNCSYARMGINAVQLSQETTEYFVNKKPSNKIIEGNYNEGFIYSINWYTNENMFTLECANKNYNQDIMTNMIELANIIDKG